MMKPLAVALLILPLFSPADAWATTAPQSQLRGIRGLSVRVQVIDQDVTLPRLLEESLQSAAESVVRYQKLAKAAGPDQVLYVTLFLSKPPGDFCAPGSVVIALETVFTDDLTFRRDPSLQSPKGIVTWHSTRGAIARPNDLAPVPLGLVRSAVESFILDIPDHEFEEPLETPRPLN